MAHCVYCGTTSDEFKDTGEHLLSNTLLRKQEKDAEDRSLTPAMSQFYLRANGFVGGDLTIKEVCAPCNNGPLSQLDTYIGQLYDQCLAQIVRAGETVKFSYDYDLLCRWLLKTSYNTARAHNHDVDTLSNCADYILRGAPRPKLMMVSVQLVIPWQPESGKEFDTVNPQAGESGEIAPRALRVGRFDTTLTEHASNVACARWIGINSYYFYLFLPSDQVRSHDQWDTTIRDLDLLMPSNTRDRQYLDPQQSVTTLRASSVDIQESLEDHMSTHFDAFQADKDKRSTSNNKPRR